MVRDDLVDRAFAPDDRRMTILGITPAGRGAIREFEKSLMANLFDFLETLKEDDRRDLVRAVESLIRILARRDRKSSKYFPF
jgi:DNA-binding MarR family transcriptional regulator